jgi:hypothetical protein
MGSASGSILKGSLQDHYSAEDPYSTVKEKRRSCAMQPRREGIEKNRFYGQAVALPSELTQVGRGSVPPELW